MFKSFVITRKQIIITVCLAVALLAVVVLVRMEKPTPAAAEPVQERTIELVTGEFKASTKDGKVIETYRWDPGTIIVEKDQPVKLRIFGVNGAHHSFYIEGMNIKGEVMQGKETIVRFTPSKEGTFRLVCETHADLKNNGPMIAYITVD
jgi:heme/copper-type cytochrome/quinol oxidase subunit 2